MSPKHGCYPEERGQRERKGGAVFSPSLVLRGSAARWGALKTLNFRKPSFQLSLAKSFQPTIHHCSLFHSIFISLLQYCVICSCMPMISLLLMCIYSLYSIQWAFSAPSSHISCSPVITTVIRHETDLQSECFQMQKCLNFDLTWPKSSLATMNLPYHLLWRGVKQVVRL